jgi:ComF family protein
MTSLVDRVLDWIAPPRCLGCDEPGVRAWCAKCELPAPPARIPSVLGDVPLRVAGAYQGALAAAIRRFKYDARADLARPLAHLLLGEARELIEVHARIIDDSHSVRRRGWRPGRASLTPPTWVPVPLHASRLAERGFNQSALLARHLASWTRTRTAPRGLLRERETGQQALLGRAARQDNVSAAFRVGQLAATEVVLVDDVVTSGATARACLETLARAGCTVIAVFALAFAEP